MQMLIYVLRNFSSDQCMHVGPKPISTTLISVYVAKKRNFSLIRPTKALCFKKKNQIIYYSTLFIIVLL